MPDAFRSATADAVTPATMLAAAEVTLLTLDDRQLNIVLVTSSDLPTRGRPSLPAVFVGAEEELDAAARRALRDQIGRDAPVRQFLTTGGVDRVPGRRVIGIAYMALLPLTAVRPLLGERVQLHPLQDGVVRAPSGRRLTLPLAEDAIVAGALADLKTHLDLSTWVFGLLAPEFSLRELQHAHEAIRGVALNKPAFRKRLLESGRLEPTGRRETDQRFRPAELYRLREENAGGR